MLRQVSDPIKAMLTCDMRESRTKVIKIDGFSCEVGVQILWTCFRGRWSNQNRARRPGSRRGPVGRSTPGIYCRLIQLCRAAMGAMCGCCGEAPPAAPSRAPGLPFSFFSFVRLWAPVPLRAPPAGVVCGSIAPQKVAGRADCGSLRHRKLRKASLFNFPVFKRGDFSDRHPFVLCVCHLSGLSFLRSLPEVT